MDSNSQNISNKLSPPGELERGYGALILTRKSSNPTCTLGELTSEDGVLKLVTKEGKIPQNRQGYIMWCLPPGEYPLEIEYCCIMYKDKPIHAYWPVLKKIPWFPKAGFFTGTAASANKGRIKIGTEKVDDYQITGDEEACQQMVRWSKTYYDEHIDDPSLTLEILQPEDAIQFSNVSEREFRIAEKVAEEKAEQEALERELGLT